MYRFFRPPTLCIIFGLLGSSFGITSTASAADFRFIDLGNNFRASAIQDEEGVPIVIGTSKSNPEKVIDDTVETLNLKTQERKISAQFDDTNLLLVAPTGLNRGQGAGYTEHNCIDARTCLGFTESHSFNTPYPIQEPYQFLGEFAVGACVSPPDNDNHLPGQRLPCVSYGANQNPIYLSLVSPARSGIDNAAYAVNSRRDVVGETVTQGGASHAFLFSNGEISDLGTLGGFRSGAYDINESGQVVGFAEIAGPIAIPATTHAFLYSKEKGMQDINPSGCLGSSIANSISDTGIVTGVCIVSSNIPHSDNVFAPFVLDLNHPGSNLLTAIPSEYRPLSFLNINAAGNTIVGSYIRLSDGPNTALRGFVLSSYRSTTTLSLELVGKCREKLAKKGFVKRGSTCTLEGKAWISAEKPLVAQNLTLSRMNPDTQNFVGLQTGSTNASGSFLVRVKLSKKRGVTANKFRLESGNDQSEVLVVPLR